MTDQIRPLGEPRNWTTDERRRMAAAYKAALALDDTSVAPDRAVFWHDIDAPMTPDQLDELPKAHPGIDPRTDLLWVKFLPRAHRGLTVSMGRYDYETGNWKARLAPAEDDDHWGTIAPIAWARIVPGQKPWDGPIVPEHIAERS
jgi:hypothetical protein